MELITAYLGKISDKAGTYESVDENVRRMKVAISQFDLFCQTIAIRASAIIHDAWFKKKALARAEAYIMAKQDEVKEAIPYVKNNVVAVFELNKKKPYATYQFQLGGVDHSVSELKTELERSIRNADKIRRELERRRKLETLENERIYTMGHIDGPSRAYRSLPAFNPITSTRTVRR